MKYIWIIFLVIWISSCNNQTKSENEVSKVFADTLSPNSYLYHKRHIDSLNQNLKDSCKLAVKNISTIEYFSGLPYKLNRLDSITLNQFLDYRTENSIPFNHLDYYIFDLIKSMEDAGHRYLSLISIQKNYCYVLVYLYWDCQNSCVLYSIDNKFNIIDKFSLFSYDCDAGDSEPDYNYKECYFFDYNDTIKMENKQVIRFSDNGKIIRQ